jgi:GINS complex subunit 1
MSSESRSLHYFSQKGRVRRLKIDVEKRKKKQAPCFLFFHHFLSLFPFRPHSLYDNIVMASFGDSSYKLAKEAKRTADLLVSPYNEDLVQNICRETRMLHAKAETLLQTMRENDEMDGVDKRTSRLAQLLMHHSAVKHNKRVLFAYHRQRMEKLKELSWDVGRQGEYQRDIKSSLGPQEHKFLEEYGEMVSSYKQSFLEIDLGGNGGVGLVPPKDLFIEVRVIKDAGEINTEYGVLNLVKGNQYFVRRTDVETLIKAGYLKHVS